MQAILLNAERFYEECGILKEVIRSKKWVIMNTGTISARQTEIWFFKADGYGKTRMLIASIYDGSFFIHDDYLIAISGDGFLILDMEENKLVQSFSGTGGIETILCNDSALYFSGENLYVFNKNTREVKLHENKNIELPKDEIDCGEIILSENEDNCETFEEFRAHLINW